MTSLAQDIEYYAGLYQPDADRIQLGAERQAALWRRETPDAWPICLGGPLTPEQQDIPNPDLSEAFGNIDLMICSQLRGACGAANGLSDSVPAVRGNYGTGVLLSCLGLEQQVFPDKMPWLKEHLSKEEVTRLTPDEIAVQGSFEMGLDFMRRHREIFGDRLPLLCMDTQGPMDLAHLLLGDELFLLFYDDPSFVHHALELCLELGIRTHTWMKEASGEPLDVCHHMGGVRAVDCGIRICEDTSAIVGQDIIEEFAIPYSRRLAEHFGGGWVHYCGRNDALTRAVCEAPELKGINFGHMPAGKQAHDCEADMQLCAETGTIYYGMWPRKEGESGENHLRRLHHWATTGCLLLQANTAMGGPDGVDAAAQLLDFWYSL